MKLLTTISMFAWAFIHRQRDSVRATWAFATADWTDDAWWRVWDVELGPVLEEGTTVRMREGAKAEGAKTQKELK